MTGISRAFSSDDASTCHFQLGDYALALDKMPEVTDNIIFYAYRKPMPLLGMPYRMPQIIYFRIAPVNSAAAATACHGRQSPFPAGQIV